MKFKEADFYYGAVLSLLFNNGIDPALVESSNSRQIYDFTTDNVDFRLFIKYRTRGRLGKKDNVFCKYFFPVFADTFCSSHPGEFTCNFSLKNF